MHLGSWRRRWDGGGYLSYAEMAEQLPGYLKDMGYTHVEMMPLSEYPYDPSWGYQVSNYYSPTSRYGTPDELKMLIDALHQAGIGVILDWVPAHFPKDEYGLYEFDGGCTYEYQDPMMNEHAEWTTRIFDWGRPEVKSFLISNAVYWLNEFHVDGIRVDAVSSMLYLDYARPNYRPNRYGGRENLEAIEFLKQLNIACFNVRKGIITCAEESTAFPMVTRPTYDGGLGFLLKWNMGWMNDTLRYMKEDPIYRKYKHNTLTFSMTYAFSENYILPLSHDEVVHLKGSLLNKMPGDYFWKFAGARVLRGYQMAHPGKKLSFMGAELGQFTEWNFNKDIDWILLDHEMHQKIHLFYKELNHFYKEHSELWADDLSWEGYQWIQPDDGDSSVLAFRRIDPKKGKELICVLSFTPVCRDDYRLGLPKEGTYEPVFCSDDWRYGGTNQLPHEVKSEPIGYREYQHSGLFRIPPMSVTFYARKSERPGRKKAEEAVEE
jgi:1,4-alpha-glucan branching enzyme